MFACLEVNYEEVNEDPTGEAYRQLQQTLTFYELDLGTLPLDYLSSLSRSESRCPQGKHPA